MSDTVHVHMTMAEYAGVLYTEPRHVGDALIEWVAAVCKRARVRNEAWSSMSWPAEHSHLFGGPPHDAVPVVVTRLRGRTVTIDIEPPPLTPALIERIAVR